MIYIAILRNSRLVFIALFLLLVQHLGCVVYGSSAVKKLESKIQGKFATKNVFLQPKEAKAFLKKSNFQASKEPITKEEINKKYDKKKKKYSNGPPLHHLKDVYIDELQRDTEDSHSDSIQTIPAFPTGLEKAALNTSQTTEKDPHSAENILQNAKNSPTSAENTSHTAENTSTIIENVSPITYERTNAKVSRTKGIQLIPVATVSKNNGNKTFMGNATQDLLSLFPPPPPPPPPPPLKMITIFTTNDLSNLTNHHSLLNLVENTQKTTPLHTSIMKEQHYKKELQTLPNQENDHNRNKNNSNNDNNNRSNNRDTTTSNNNNHNSKSSSMVAENPSDLLSLIENHDGLPPISTSPSSQTPQEFKLTNASPSSSTGENYNRNLQKTENSSRFSEEEEQKSSFHDRSYTEESTVPVGYSHLNLVGEAQSPSTSTSILSTLDQKDINNSRETTLKLSPETKDINSGENSFNSAPPKNKDPDSGNDDLEAEQFVAELLASKNENQRKNTSTNNTEEKGGDEENEENKSFLKHKKQRKLKINIHLKSADDEEDDKDASFATKGNKEASLVSGESNKLPELSKIDDSNNNNNDNEQPEKDEKNSGKMYAKLLKTLRKKRISESKTPRKISSIGANSPEEDVTIKRQGSQGNNNPLVAIGISLYRKPEHDQYADRKDYLYKNPKPSQPINKKVRRKHKSFKIRASKIFDITNSKTSSIRNSKVFNTRDSKTYLGKRCSSHHDNKCHNFVTENVYQNAFLPTNIKNLKTDLKNDETISYDNKKHMVKQKKQSTNLPYHHALKSSKISALQLSPLNVGKGHDIRQSLKRPIYKWNKQRTILQRNHPWKRGKIYNTQLSPPNGDGGTGQAYAVHRHQQIDAEEKQEKLRKIMRILQKELNKGQQKCRKPQQCFCIRFPCTCTRPGCLCDSSCYCPNPPCFCECSGTNIPNTNGMAFLSQSPASPTTTNVQCICESQNQCSCTNPGISTPASLSSSCLSNGEPCFDCATCCQQPMAMETICFIPCQCSNNIKNNDKSTCVQTPCTCTQYPCSCTQNLCPCQSPCYCPHPPCFCACGNDYSNNYNNNNRNNVLMTTSMTVDPAQTSMNGNPLLQCNCASTEQCSCSPIPPYYNTINSYAPWQHIVDCQQCCLQQPSFCSLPCNCDNEKDDDNGEDEGNDGEGSIVIKEKPLPTTQVAHAEPVAQAASPMVIQAAPTIRQAAPPVIQAAPVIIQTASPTPQAAPLIPQATPPVVQAAPPILQAPPPVVQAAPPLQAAPPVVQAAPPIPQAAPPILQAAPPPPMVLQTYKIKRRRKKKNRKICYTVPVKTSRYSSSLLPLKSCIEQTIPLQADSDTKSTILTPKDVPSAPHQFTW